MRLLSSPRVFALNLLRRVRLLGELLRAPGRTHRYGPHRSQRAELYLPRGDGPHPVMVLIHGGSWRKRYGMLVMRALAGDLRRRGWAVWNIEYRRLGAGGGWPQTFVDVAAAIDLLASVRAPLDRGRVSLLGHSAGGHLALWAAGRGRLPSGAPGAIEGMPAVALERVIALAGVCDLAGAYRAWRGGAVRALLGGSPQDLPERYALADPLAVVPLAIPALLVHGVRDETVTVELSRNYARAAAACGAEVALVEIEGEDGRHRAFIEPRSEAWATVLRSLAQPTGTAPADGDARAAGAAGAR